MLILLMFLPTKEEKLVESSMAELQEKSEIYYRLQRLINPKQMGKLFKVIFAFKLKKKFTMGFV